MKNGRWIIYPEAFIKFHEKTIKAQVTDGDAVYDGTGEIRVRKSLEPDKVEVMFVFKNQGPVTGKQLRCYLTEEQVFKIQPSKDGSVDFQFTGTLMPVDCKE